MNSLKKTIHPLYYINGEDKNNTKRKSDKMLPEQHTTTSTTTKISAYIKIKEYLKRAKCDTLLSFC